MERFSTCHHMSSKALPGLEAATKTKYSPLAKNLLNLAIIFTSKFGAFQAEKDEEEMILTEVLIQRDHIELSRSLYPITQEELEDNLAQLNVPKSVYEQLELLQDSRERVIYTVNEAQYHNDLGNVAIIGDSAHACYPSLGGGYNSGLEDVTYICDCICNNNESNKTGALLQYSKQRAPVGRALVDISTLLTYSPALLVSSAGQGRLLQFACRALIHFLTCGLVKASTPSMSVNNDAVMEYATCQKTTVELAEE